VLEIASTPVSDEPPLANARSSTNSLAPMTNPSRCSTCTAPARWAESYCGSPTVTILITPTTTMITMSPTNRYAGIAKGLPASRSPRRLTKHNTATVTT
jgi:hypothetical protein